MCRFGRKRDSGLYVYVGRNNINVYMCLICMYYIIYTADVTSRKFQFHEFVCNGGTAIVRDAIIIIIMYLI